MTATGEPFEEKAGTEENLRMEAELRAIAHDIRNALFGVAMNLELVAEVSEGSPEPTRDRAIAHARHEITRIGTIADALTALAARSEARGATRR